VGKENIAGGVGLHRPGTGQGTVRSKVAEDGRVGWDDLLVVAPDATKSLGTPTHNRRWAVVKEYTAVQARSGFLRALPFILALLWMIN
jgi:hypothetical protein